ncbi:FHA domain-containing protein [Streptomyces misionensis]|uniref:FHA domain-containing protein n=1 Tax=Streptomyces misionensis TaxID=67331 RepID=A0A5C6J2T8_9ACTN|nr:FHA domain-containing protein [Streptomyces misionensis]TWV35122.1 FHA domain-containing protein [Streptomyces misionensis]
MLELTMATVSAADAGATAGMTMAQAPSEPGAVLRVGRDAAVCRLVVPEDWLFVSRVHLEFSCGPDGTWRLTWLRGSQPDPASEVRLTVGESTGTLGYGATVPLPRGVLGEVVVRDRGAPRSVDVGFCHEA